MQTFNELQLAKELIRYPSVTPIDAVVVDIPFTESYYANTREVVKG